MFEELKKSVIIEYLLNEIDLCEPLEEVYKTYCDDLYKISDLDVELECDSYRKKFIMKSTSMTKSDILKFCEQECFLIDLYKVEEVLKRQFTINDFGE
tara:strand:+ start:578 stop:871 length:294 start_codon:yes stop_codon:yes gene_type:complete